MEEKMKDYLMSAGMIILIGIIVAVAISANDYKEFEFRKYLNGENALICHNFDMRYRFINSSCYECYYPLNNVESIKGYNYVYQFCNLGNFSLWNRTSKYLEPRGNSSV
jgi:hypothetical protein